MLQFTNPLFFLIVEFRYSGSNVHGDTMKCSENLITELWHSEYFKGDNDINFKDLYQFNGKLLKFHLKVGAEFYHTKITKINYFKLMGLSHINFYNYSDYP